MILTRTWLPIRLFATVFVVLALLWGAVMAPAHAVSMMAMAVAEVATPCPMSGGMDHAMADDMESGAPIDSMMEGNTSCCPPPAVSSSGRIMAVHRIVIDVPLEVDAVSSTALAMPGVEPRPPQG